MTGEARSSAMRLSCLLLENDPSARRTKLVGGAPIDGCARGFA
jgi:hypothetical protein